MASDNPFRAAGGGYAPAASPGVSFGAPAEAAAPTQPASLPPAPLSQGQVRDVTTASFSADVLQASRQVTVLVDFWAPWCGPCKQLAPVLEKVVAASGGAVTLAKMNIDDHPSIAGQLGIQSIPAVIAFRDGKPVDGFMGALPESQIRDFVKRVGGTPGKDQKEQLAAALAAAAEARAAGDAQRAADIYAMILDNAPDTVEATAGLAEILFEAGEIEQTMALLDEVPADKQAHQAIAALRTRMRLAAETAELGDASEFEHRLTTDPNDHQARFDLAMLRNANGDRDGAAGDLLTIVRTDRAWNDGAARAKLLELFESWGLMDPATLAARRKLSSLLFS